MVFVSYFPKFLWSPFLIFFFKCANASLFQKSPNVFLYLNITIVWSLNLIWLNHQPFGIFFESRKHFHNSFHSFVSYDWRIRWVVSYKSVSYRKGMRALKPLQNKKGQKNSRCTVFGVFFSDASCKQRQHGKLCTWKIFWSIVLCDDFSLA